MRPTGGTDGTDLRRARTHFDAAEYRECLDAALAGLNAAPDDIELLLLAGRAELELDSAEALEHLRRATELAPNDAAPWHHYGEALAAEGRTDEAEAAFRRAVELDPDDQLALTHLGHTALAAGRNDEGVEYLARVADIAHAPSTAVISLVEMYRTFGQFDQALVQANRVAAAAPDDVLAWLDVAELSLAVRDFDEARSAFERLRELDDTPGHEAYPLHGLILVEIRREDWQRAHELVAQAAAIESAGITGEVHAALDAQAAAAGDEQASSMREVVESLNRSLADYRRMLVEDRHLGAGDILV